MGLAVWVLAIGAFPLLDVVVLADMIGDETTTRADARSQHCALRTTHQTADHGTAYCRAADYLGLGVMARVAALLLSLRALVL